MTMHGGTPPPTAPKAPPEPMDPGMVAALVDHQYGFAGIGALTKPITYVIGSNGVFELRKNRIGVACKEMAKFTTPLAGIPAGEGNLKEGYLLGVPKVPFLFYQQIVAFFRDVNDAHKTEAMVQVWFNHDTGLHQLHVPLQNVSGGMVEHAGDFDKDPSGNFSHVMDIHSHHTMGAFWSGTDDADEARHERLYGVIGLIDKLIPASKWRARTTGKFLDLDMTEVIDIPDVKVEFTITDYHYPLADLMKKGGNDLSLSFGKEGILDPFKGVTYPKSDWWAQLITDKRDPRIVKRDRPAGGSNHRWGHGWDDHRGSFGGGHLGAREISDEDWEDRLMSRFITSPSALPICTRWVELGRPEIFLRHVPTSNPAGYAVFYRRTQVGGGFTSERAPFAEERAILGTMPQAGFLRIGDTTVQGAH